MAGDLLSGGFVMSAPVGGFRLAYERTGSGPPVVLLLHGWPGARSDFRAVRARLAGTADVVVPDLRGFGDSDRHPAPPEQAYSAEAQASSVLGLIDELGLERPVIGGYDVGSRVAQAVAQLRPAAVRALVLSPPLPGVGDRVLAPDAQAEFWYQPFHRLVLAEALIDDRETVGAYLEHFWRHWSAPGWKPPRGLLDELVAAYARPGAFAASIAWYRAGSGTVAQAARERVPPPGERLAVPATVLWPEKDPLFPTPWSDRLDQFLSAAELRMLPGVGHFVPLEAPDAFADALREGLEGSP